MREFPQIDNLHYKALTSGTEFDAEPPDSEEFGLADIHREQRQAILDLQGNDTNILIMGGMSGIGKTHLLWGLKQEHNFRYCSFEAPTVNASNASSVEEEVVLFDEGMIATASYRTECPETIRALLKNGKKIVVSGGGANVTAQEQSDELSQLLEGVDARKVVNTFPFRQLNVRQTSELIEAETSRSFDKLSPDDCSKLADAIHPYFRLPRIVTGLYAAADVAQFNRATCTFVPEAIWRELSYIQEDNIKEVYQAITTS